MEKDISVNTSTFLFDSPVDSDTRMCITVSLENRVVSKLTWSKLMFGSNKFVNSDYSYFQIVITATFLSLARSEPQTFIKLIEAIDFSRDIAALAALEAISSCNICVEVDQAISKVFNSLVAA